jgi:hypothetical protein
VVGKFDMLLTIEEESLMWKPWLVRLEELNSPVHSLGGLYLRSVALILLD